MNHGWMSIWMNSFIMWKWCMWQLHGVIVDISSQFAPFIIGVHYMLLWKNIIIQTLFALHVVNHLEIIMQSFYKYFFGFLKRYLKLVKLGEIMEIKIWRSWTMSIFVGFLCWTHSYKWCKSIIHFYWRCHHTTLQYNLLHSTWKI
jgi:hypothetical protein